MFVLKHYCQRPSKFQQMQVLPTEHCRYKVTGLLTADVQSFNTATLHPPHSYTETSSPDSAPHFQDSITTNILWSSTD